MPHRPLAQRLLALMDRNTTGPTPLTHAHGDVEGSHRGEAWTMVLGHVDDEGELARRVVATREKALELWNRHRDGVAERMQLLRGAAE